MNAITLRFRKNGTRVSGWWLASFPAAELDNGFAGGVGLQVRGRLLPLATRVPTSLPASDVESAPHRAAR